LSLAFFKFASSNSLAFSGNSAARVAYLRSPVEELGRHATKMLLREINNLISEPAPEIFDLPLIEGQSGILEM